MRVRVRGRHAYRWPTLRAVVREQVQVQVQFWLVLGFCFCSPQAARGRGVAHAGVLGGWYRCWFGRRKRFGLLQNARVLAQEQVQVQDVWFAVCCCVRAVLVGVGLLLLQRSGGDMHTCMLVLAGWVQEQVQVKASGGRRERFHSYGKMLYMHTQGLSWC